jgi:molecular chaperone GrpE
MMTTEKEYSSDIAQDVIEAALKSVEKREQQAKELADLPDVNDAYIKAKEELELVKAELELSVTKGHDLMQKLKDEHEKMMRSAADLENFKKRAQKEKEEVQKFGNEKLLKDFLPVFDNFDRALEHAKTASDFDSLKKGVEMMRKLFEDTLGKHGVKSFVSKGLLFDPNKHEAMSAVETTELEPNHVHSEILRGFQLNDRLVRPALVVVSRAPTPAQTESSDKTETTHDENASKDA